MNKWYAGKGYKFNIDSMKAYNSYDEVPLYRKTVMEKQNSIRVLMPRVRTILFYRTRSEYKLFNR